MKNPIPENPVILFDGVCNLCSRFVKIIIRYDKSMVFKFSTLDSEAGKSLLSRFKHEPIPDSVVLIENNQIYTQSNAVFRIIKQLHGWPKWIYPLHILPESFNNIMYSYIASNRYKWFGKSGSCMIPDKNILHRFL